MARRECAMAALFPAERIGGLASLQPATLRLAADVRYGGHSRRPDGQQGFGHSRRPDGQQGFAECPLCQDPRHQTPPWLTALLARRPTKVAAIALANKLARMAWAMMAKGERYRQPVALAA